MVATGAASGVKIDLIALELMIAFIILIIIDDD
jgi:hypothetical protein